MGQILLYDESEMRIFDCSLFDIQPPEKTEFDVTNLEDQATKTIMRMGTTASASITLREVKAELDPTTMKRIAKYNLDKDFEELNRRISKAREELFSLDKEMNIRREKIVFIENLIERIWEDEDFDEENYLPDEDDDYEEDYVE